MRNEDLDRVVPLDQLDDFRVAADNPDVRGWEVLGSDGGRIGEVDELLVDTAAMKVRYLDVDLDAEISGEGERHVLVPIGYARLDREHDRVMVDELAAADLRALPTYGHGPLSRDFETSVRDSFPRARGGVTADGGAASADDFYAHESFDEDRFWAARRSGSPGAGGRGTEPAAGGLGNADPASGRVVDEPGGPGNSDPGTRADPMR